VTPRAVLAWLPNANTNIYVSYSVGFRSGLEQTPLALVAEPNFPPARPDRLHNYEVGAKGSLWGGVVTYDASIFYIKWNDIQQNGQLEFCNPVCVPVGGTINGTSASGPGYDLSLAVQLARGLKLGLAFSQNNLTEDANVYPAGVGGGPNNGAVYVKGDRTPFSAQYTANASLDYSWALTGNLDGTFEISGNYRSSELIILPPAQGTTLNTTDYTLCNNGNFCYTSGSPTNLNLRFEIANHHNQRLSLYATNLTNWSGFSVPGTEQSTEIRERPRTIGIQFEARF
jgi:outer membrane receptor protein involved in Fe transport